MPKSFLGVGWCFPIELDANGQIKQAAYEESVRQSIWIILGTAKGERLMRPDFGCGMHDLVFAPNTASTAGQVSEAVQEALLSFEPRIDVIDVQVTPGSQGQVLLISLDYRVRATNNVFNLVYPFYLERGTVP
ncbi:MAG: GPW/gp25 family protein [Anaerolineales bacterium]|nr:GPW/gp25 family protein [Anaerolineales bacterium]